MVNIKDLEDRPDLILKIEQALSQDGFFNIVSVGGKICFQDQQRQYELYSTNLDTSVNTSDGLNIYLNDQNFLENIKSKIKERYTESVNTKNDDDIEDVVNKLWLNKNGSEARGNLESYYFHQDIGSNPRLVSIPNNIFSIVTFEISKKKHFIVQDETDFKVYEGEPMELINLVEEPLDSFFKAENLRMVLAEITKQDYQSRNELGYN